MKKRITGRVNGGNYEVLDTAGGVIRQVPLSEARGDTKLIAAIARNGWEAIPDAG
jgi:hypothetical protein